MSSKMLSWIKKRCGRRPEKPDGNLKSTDYTKLSATTNPPVYNSLDMNLLRQKERENTILYDEVYEEGPESIKVTEKATPSSELRVCPLCRSKISTDNSCKCVHLRRNLRSRKLQVDHDVSSNTLQETTNSTDDDSSGFYESVGSDSMSSGEMYSDNSVTTDSDDGYEEVEFRPSLGHRRRYSVGSLHTVLQRSKLHSTFKVGNKDRNFTLRRTIERRSLKVKNVRTAKVYIL